MTTAIPLPPSTVEPFAAHACAELPDEALPALRDLAVAVNGFVYHGSNLDTLAMAARWLRANPDTARQLLGLT